MSIRSSRQLRVAVVLFSCFAVSSLRAESPGNPPPELKTLNGHFPFVVPPTKAAWEARAESLRNNIKVATGLWPEPQRTPLNPVIHGKVQRDGFTFEKVYFESLPGHYVTGLLFRPDDGKPTETKRPGVLCPHGHGGRMERHTAEQIQQKITAGHERYVASGQTPTLARCVQLARMGCVVFIFDMLGYADSVQIPYDVAHRHAVARPEESRPFDGTMPPSWIMFSIDAELRLQSIMGLQTWNASRSLDFLASLSDVDPERLGVTGNSGGGTQTILLGAIDPRVKVSFPNGMVSTSMQGGCYCENCSLLRVDTGNVELAGLMAPRPQAMTAVDDWTRDMMTDGYPQLRQLYRMVGNEQDVHCAHFPTFPHNYNYVTRSLMYPWMNRYLSIGAKEPIVEGDFQVITDEEASVWNAEHPRPTSVSPKHEHDVCQWFDAQSRAAIDSMWPKTAEDVDEFQGALSGAWRIILSIDESDDRNLQFTANVSNVAQQFPGAKVLTGSVKNATTANSIPVTILEPISSNPIAKTVVWCADGGRSEVLSASQDDTGAQDRTAMLSRLLKDGYTVWLPDLMDQRSSAPADAERQRLIDDKRHYAAFTFGYNKTLFAQRVAEVMDVLTHVIESSGQPVGLIGSGNIAPVVLAASALTAKGRVDRTVVLLDGFRFGNVDSYASVDFVPGSVKYGDVDTLVALAAPHKLWLRAASNTAIQARQVYEKLGEKAKLVEANYEATDSPRIPVNDIAAFLGN